MDSQDVFNTLKALRKMKKETQKKKPLKDDLEYLQKIKPMSQQELRQNFQNELSKLNELDTKDKALNRIKELVQQTVSQQSFQMLVSTLTAPLPQGNESFIKVVQIITEIYGTKISVQDLYKLIDYTMKHFKFQNLQQACSDCWTQFYESNAMKLDLQQRSLLLYQTLIGVISGGASRQEQESAMVVLNKIYEIMNEHRDIRFLRDTIKSFTPIYLKCQIDHASVHMSMIQVLLCNTIQSFKNNQIPIVDKALQVLKNSRYNYRTRIAVCNLLKLIGEQYSKSQFTVIGSFHNQVIGILEQQTRDRIIAIQNASRVALKEWMKVKMVLDGQDLRKMNKIADDVDFDQLLNKPIQQQQEEDDIVINQVEESKFIKKKSGTGGGNVWMINERKIKQSQLEMKQVIKNRVYNKDQLKYQEDEEQVDELERTIDYNESRVIKQSKEEKKQEKKQDSDNKDIWQEANNLYELGCKDQAIEYLLREGDDIYLLRMLLKNQSDILQNIGYDTKRQLIDRLILVFNCDFINRLCLDFVQGYFEANAGEMLVEDKNEGDKFKDFLDYMSQQDNITGVQCKSILKQLN